MDQDLQTPVVIIVLVVIVAAFLLWAFNAIAIARVNNPLSIDDSAHRYLATQVSELRSDVQALSTTVADMAGALR